MKVKRQVLLFLMALLPIVVSADAVEIDGIYYDFSDNEAKVIKGENAYSGDVVIPASVTYKGKSYNVTSIGDLAFFQCGVLTSVSIPESITNIGQLAFATCAGLTSITIPSSVISIGVGAFAECTGLTSIIIPEKMTSISESLLSGCSSLTSITIPKHVTSIGENAFAYCYKLKNVYSYAEQVPSTADNAFENTPIQTAILVIQETSAEAYLATEPWRSFGSFMLLRENYPQLENSSFDEWHIVGSGNQALYNPWKEGGKSYWDTGNRGATTVGASNSTYGIEDGRTYANLQSKFIVIKFAAGNIFTGSYLKTDGSNGILSLGRPFTGRPTKLRFDYTYNSSIVNRGGGKWDEKYSRYISKVAYDKMSNHTVNDSCCIWVALIGDKDEEEFDGVTYPFIIRTRPSNLHLFDPNDENVIAYGQFTSGDDQLEWVTKTIDIRYRNTRTPKYIIVVASSSKYGDFFIGGDQSLLQLDNIGLFYDDNIFIEGQTFFAEQANGIQMEFKVISKEKKTCQVGSGTRACINADTSGEINIPDEVMGFSVVGIGKGAFYNCSNIKSVTIPESVTSIDSYVFSGCNSLTSITIPRSVTTINSNVFYGCTNLTSLILHCKYVDSWFKGNTSVKKLVLGNEVTSVGSSAFYGCMGLSSITIGNNVTSIGSNAFYGCNSSNFYAKRGTDGLISVWKYGIDPYEVDTLEKLMRPSISMVSTTQTSITYQINNVYPELEYQYDNNSKPLGDNKYLIQGLRPELSYPIDVVVKSANNSYNIAYNATTSSISPTVTCGTITPTSMTVRGSFIKGDANIVLCTLMMNGKEMPSDEGSLYGLDPNKSYNCKYSVVVEYGNGNKYTYYGSQSIRTATLNFSTQQPKVVSPGNVVVSAESNLSDEETKVGFEWRRIDWTDDFASNTGGAYLFGGKMEGYIRNLNADKLWKYRPYYESNSGKRYYGEWVGIDPTNTSYFEPTVYTYSTYIVSDNTAEVKGYAMRGSDNVIKQGFMYWKASPQPSPDAREKHTLAIPGNAKMIEASGNVMIAKLDNLDFDTEYCYVAFVTTSENETFYGEPQRFKTGINQDLIDGIEGLGSAQSIMPNVESIYDLNGCKLSSLQKGLNIIRMTDGTTRKVMIK